MEKPLGQNAFKTVYSVHKIHIINYKLKDLKHTFRKRKEIEKRDSVVL